MSSKKRNILLNISKEELVDEILKLREQIKETKEKNKSLKGEVKELEWTIKDLNNSVKDLKWKLKMDSHNSSMPPSTDGFKKKNHTCNSRAKSDKPRWGQTWHKGRNLQRNKDVNETIDISPLVCEKCGENFLNGLSNVVSKSVRQVIDVSTPSKQVTDYVWHTIKCGKCGHINTPNFPQWVTEPVQYGPHIRSISLYIYYYLSASYNKLQDYWKEVYGINISQTTLNKIGENTYEDLKDFDAQMSQTLLGKELLHADETWMRVNGENYRIHTVCTEFLSYYAHHKKRGSEAIDSFWILNKYLWKLVTDHWGGYKGEGFTRNFCNAHHLRELTWSIENENKLWAQKMKDLLLEIKARKNMLISEGKKEMEAEERLQYHTRYRQIIADWTWEYEEVIRKEGQRGRLKKAKWLNLALRLEKNEDGTLWFMDDFTVPFDNNLAERALRMIKLRQKVSWCFRSEDGIQWFCRIMSYISTTKKQSSDIYKAVLSLFQWNIILPDL